MVLRGHCLRWWEGPSGRSYIFCRSPRATWNCFWAVNTVSQVLNPLGSRKITARYSDGATHAFLAYSLIRLRRVFLSLWGTFTFQQSLPYAWFSVYVYAYGQMFIYVLECFLTKQCWSKAHCQSNHGSSVILPGSCLLLAKLFWGHYSRPVSSTNRSGISAGAVHFSWIAGVCSGQKPYSTWSCNALSFWNTHLTQQSTQRGPSTGQTQPLLSLVSTGTTGLLTDS